MEHDTSEDFACDIKKVHTVVITIVCSVTFPLVDSDIGGILPRVRELAMFPTEV